jgi:hypothetical protein
MIDIDTQQELQYELIDDEKSDGNGNIIFSQGDFVFGMISGMIWQGMGTRVVPRFELIGDVRNVYNIILKLQRT